MNPLSTKEYFCLEAPTEELSVSDHRRLLLALEQRGYENVTVPLPVLQQLYPLCRTGGFTATLVHREQGWILTAIEASDTRHTQYGLAVDYGSTTILMQLIDLTSGAVIGEENAVNGQVAYGTDILSRITWALEDPVHVDALQAATVQTFEQLLAQLTESTGFDAASCPIMVISGNTTMIHFLLKLNAWTVFASPYAPVVTDPGFFWGRELGMDFGGLVYIVPSASNYIGGDIISGLLTLDIHKSHKTCLFFDIGTNGELVIGNKDWMMAGAGAAGPALEGYISRFGMRAAPGAIDRVTIDGTDLRFTVLGGQKPVGICGSGIIDLIAQMRLNGWINIAGQLNPEASPRIRYIADQQEYAAVYATEEESATGEMLYFSQTDLNQYLDTKAAAYTMIECLLESAGTDVSDLDICYLSGAFSAHSDLEAAITVGIFPDLPREKFVCIANTSLAGARTLLLDHGRIREAKALSENLYCVQFASVPDFLIRMQAAKFIPHTDMNRYPSITEKLRNC